MAIPVVTATPNSGAEGDLPITVTVSGTNIFERNDYTGRDLLTQVAPDAPASAWKGGAVQIDGIIGKAFLGNGTDSEIELDPIPFSADHTWSGFITRVDNGGQLTFFCLWDDNVNTAYLNFKVTPGGKLRIYAIQAAQNIGYEADFALNDGQRYHVMLSFISGVPTFCVDTDVKSNHVYYTETGLAPGGGTLTPLIGSRKSHYFNGTICQPYWSTNPAFKNRVAEYANLPTVELN